MQILHKRKTFGIFPIYSCEYKITLFENKEQVIATMYISYSPFSIMK